MTDFLPKDVSSAALIIFGLSMLGAQAFSYFGKRVRVPLKRAHDQHVERMVELLERLAQAVERLDVKLNGVVTNVEVLKERG